MANRPANAGSGRELAGAPPLGAAVPPLGAPAPPLGAAAPPVRAARPLGTAPPAVHHQHAPRAAHGHRAPRPKELREPRDSHPGTSWVGGLAWAPYLIVLAGVAAGMFIAWQGSRYAGRGAGLVGCSLLAAGLVRLLLPPRFAALLSSRRKASDVLAFAAFGAAVLAFALMLP